MACGVLLSSFDHSVSADQSVGLLGYNGGFCPYRLESTILKPGGLNLQIATAVVSLCEVDLAFEVRNKLPVEAEMAFSTGCVNDPDGDFLCVPEGTGYTIDFTVPTDGTFTNMACVTLGGSVLDLANHCTCVEITLPGGLVEGCAPIDVAVPVFGDGFESGDVSEWG